MKLDFWQYTHDPLEKVVALIAKRALGEGERVLVVSADAEQRAVIARTLWQAGPETFLANGEADAPGAELQPILLSTDIAASNGASHLILAMGLTAKAPDLPACSCSSRPTLPPLPGSLGGRMTGARMSPAPILRRKTGAG